MLAQLAKHEQLLKQCSLLAVFGTGALAAKHVRQRFRNTHPRVANTKHLKNHNALVGIVAAFDNLGKDADTQRLADMLEDALEISDTHTANERTFNRFICEINAHARAMVLLLPHASRLPTKICPHWTLHSTPSSTITFLTATNGTLPAHAAIGQINFFVNQCHYAHCASPTTPKLPRT